ncbi:MAG: DUF4136 domain-containing protein [Candidatus Krumholzibacteria bacterium]|nr:DUF4136 domain-containing protein [Candidatus Krumholzibacteria bacterium]
MKISALLLVIAGVALLAGCGSSIELSNDFDQQVNFQQVYTYQWAESNNQGGDLLAKRIKNAVNDQLAQNGMTETTTSPDVYVMYHIGTKDKVDVSSYGYSYGGYGRYGGAYGGPYSAGGGGISTYNYTEGTLIIDMYEAENKQLVWRGSGTDVIEDNPTPQQLTENVNKAVAAIMSQYPPKK